MVSLVSGIQGVLDAYRCALTNVQLWGPTNAAPIINHVARFAEKADMDPKAQVSSGTATGHALRWRDLDLPLLCYSCYRTTSSC